MKFKAILPCLFLALSLISMAAHPVAAAYPDKPVSMIIAFTAGGSSDVQARIMQKYWDKYVKEPWVFVYKPGAGGIIGFTEIAKANPDGYTIGGLNVPHLVLQSLAQRASFNADSFEYIAQVVNDPQCIAVLKSSKFKSFKDIIDAAKASPNAVRVGLVGPLSGHHLMFLEFNKLFPDVKLSRVFYKGAADQNAALLGGEVDLIFGNINDVMRSIDEFNVLNVAAEKRNDFLPDVPTLRELGYDFSQTSWRVLVVNKDTPDAIVEKLAKASERALNSPAMKKSAEENYEILAWLPPSEADAFLQSEFDFYRDLSMSMGLHYTQRPKK